MAVYLCGDVHGTLAIQKAVNFLTLDPSKSIKLNKVTSFIRGDVGDCRDGGAFDREVIGNLSQLPAEKCRLSMGTVKFSRCIIIISSQHGTLGRFMKSSREFLRLMRKQLVKINGKTFLRLMARHVLI